MKVKPSYHEQITSCLRKAKKKKDSEAVLYYTQALNWVACVSFERFKGTLAHSEWTKKHKENLEQIENEFKRFAF